jgi:hypothetical protein
LVYLLCKQLKQVHETWRLTHVRFG